MINEIKLTGDWDLEKLVMVYQQTRNEELFKRIWQLVKPFSIKISNKYPSISYEDRESISMQTLWESCLNLKEGKKLLTMYGTVLKNRLFDLYAKHMQRGKYKINSEAYSLEKMAEDINYQPSVKMDVFIEEDFYRTCELRNIEIALVQLLNQGYKRREIARELNIKINEYDTMLRIIQNKVENNWSKSL